MRLGRFLNSLLIYINLINISLRFSYKQNLLGAPFEQIELVSLHFTEILTVNNIDQQVLLKCLYYTFYLFLVITLKALFIFPCKMHTNIYKHVKTYIYTFRIVVLVFLVLDLESTLYL